MRYPHGFPLEAQDRVEAATVRAAREFDRNKQAAPSEREIRLSLVHYIMRVFGVFVRQAKVRRLWHASDMKSACLEFLRQLTIEANSEKGYDHAGRPLSPMTSHIDGSILPEVLRSFKSWPAWHQFEAALLAVATSPASGRIEAQPAPEPEQLREKPARGSPAVASGPTRESIQVNNSATVYMGPWPDRRATKRKHKSVRPRVKEPVSAKPAVAKATTETESANEVAPPITLELPHQGPTRRR